MIKKKKINFGCTIPLRFDLWNCMCVREQMQIFHMVSEEFLLSEYFTAIWLYFNINVRFCINKRSNLIDAKH